MSEKIEPAVDDLVIYLPRKNWGAGVVLSVSRSSRLTIFFLEVGEKKLKAPNESFLVLGDADIPVLSRIKGTSRRKEHSVYVVELDPAVWNEPGYRKVNPDRKASLPCLYVGQTGLSPEERFENHMRGHKHCAYVESYGLRLRPDLYEHLNPMTYNDSLRIEYTLARELRSAGYGVYQA